MMGLHTVLSQMTHLPTCDTDVSVTESIKRSTETLYASKQV